MITHDFNDFITHVYPEGTKPDQLNLLKLAFFSGAIIASSNILKNKSDPTSEAVSILATALFEAGRVAKRIANPPSEG